MKRFFPYLHYLKSVRGTLALAVVAGLVFGVASGFSIPFFIEKVFRPAFSEAARTLTAGQIWLYASALPGVFLVRGIAGFFNSYLIAQCGARVLESIRIDFFRKLQVLPLSFFQDRAAGDLVSRGVADANQVQTVLTGVTNEIVKQPATLASALAALIYFSLQHRNLIFLLLCFAMIPVMLSLVRVVARNLLKRARQMQQEMGNVTARFSENLGALKEVRAFGLEEREVARFRAMTRLMLGFQLKVVKYTQVLSPALEFFAACGIGLAFVYAYRAAISGETFFALAGALYMSYEPIKKLGIINGELKKGTAALDRLEAILHAPVTITDPPQPIGVGRLRGEIVFDRVTFAYHADVPALCDVSISIPPGTVCALVGPSGAGKSTFANLVPRFYDATAGAVRIDGHDVRSMRLADLRRNIALVSQEPVLFNDTVYNNLLIGRPDASRTEVEAAAHNAFAHEFIETMPQSYNTMIGERGASLSGGQRQRLALARAFLRDAPILILDEATSALDSQSEDAVQQAFAKLVIGKTVLIISHRFSTIRAATMILVLDAGRVAASGNHASLYENNPLYRSLYDKQH